MVVVGVVAGIISSLRTPTYEATARVLLRPNDPTEQLNPDNPGQDVVTEQDRYVAGQPDIVKSEAVVAEAVKSLPGVTVEAVGPKLSVSQGRQSNVLRISVMDPEPQKAQDIANAVANGYIENRRQSAVAGLERAANDIEKRLGPLQTTIAQFDARIGEHLTVPVATSQLVTPTAPESSSAPNTRDGRIELLPGNATTASGTEALKAARYAAAVQYETLVARQQELLINISLKRGEAELIQPAMVPNSPISPKPVRDGLLGTFAGLLLGVGVSTVRELLNDRLRSTDDVEKISGLPLLARLPLDEDTAKGAVGVVVVERPTSPIAKAIRSLRTSVQYLGLNQPIKVIVVTSSMPGEGKSLVAANLAAMFAEADYRTLLVSADLRRSSIEALFGTHRPSPGLTDLIAPFKPAGATTGTNEDGRSESQEVKRSESAGGVVCTSVKNLLLLPSGPTPPNPAELLGSRRMTSLLAGWSASADVVVLDTPPLLPVTDAAVLAARSDGVILVAAVNETKREDLKHSVTVLEGTGARLLGIVANKLPSSGRGS